MLGRDLRIAFTDFFVQRGAALLASDSLVPNDPTLLFTSAGMVQFKPYFLGLAAPEHARATTVQKCLRTTDIDDVGDTSHCTFFQMLGNFSFGDYFKADAIKWAWEFLFDVLKLDLERVRVTIFLDDDEAYELWRAQGMPDRKIFRKGEEDNFWAAGPTGPCGPDSEIFFDTQAGKLPPTPDGVWDDKRWLEIWNLVFMQFNQDEEGRRAPLPRKNIDTGSGLERTTAAINDLRGPFETDFFAPLLDKLQSLSGRAYGSQDFDPADVAFRRVADHIRATAFCIADGILPSNVGRGYVLRRLMRRAITAGRNRLGIPGALLPAALPTIIDQYAEFYPELSARRDTILRYAESEERQFTRTLESGSARLNTILANRSAGREVSGEEAFLLSATYGFPVEMTAEIAAEKGVGVDMTGYLAAVAQHEIVSGGDQEETGYGGESAGALREQGVAETLFTGYREAASPARVVAVLPASGPQAASVAAGDEARLVLDETPFYAEAGGQVGDTGLITGPSGVFEVTDTKKSGGYYFHSGVMRSGEMGVGDAVGAQINDERRRDIQRNHSTTHLLHKALQMVLGDHVQQRGSLVEPTRLRFDFSHDKAMTAGETARVEGIVNDEILADLPIETMERGIDEARAMGAMMLFGEKYGSVVRVVRMGDFSLEFCGGTHLQHTAQAGLFRIAGEGSAAAGVRRIEAVTGRAALTRMLDDRAALQQAAGLMKLPAGASLPDAVERLQSDLRAARGELAVLQRASAGAMAEQMAAEAESAGPSGEYRVVVRRVDGVADADALAALADDLAGRLPSGVIVLGAVADGRALIAARASKPAVAAGVHAGNIVKAAAQVVGGGGGGRPDAAQAGGKEPARLDEALGVARAMVVLVK